MGLFLARNQPSRGSRSSRRHRRAAPGREQDSRPRSHHNEPNPEKHSCAARTLSRRPPQVQRTGAERRGHPEPPQGTARQAPRTADRAPRLPGKGERPGPAAPRSPRLTPGRQAVDLQRQLLQDRDVLEGVVHGDGSSGPGCHSARRPGRGRRRGRLPRAAVAAEGAAPTQAPPHAARPTAPRPSRQTPRPPCRRFRQEAPPPGPGAAPPPALFRSSRVPPAAPRSPQGQRVGPARPRGRHSPTAVAYKATALATAREQPAPAPGH